MGTSLSQLQAPRAQKQLSESESIGGDGGRRGAGSQSALSRLASPSPTVTRVSLLYQYTWASRRLRPGV